MKNQTGPQMWASYSIEDQDRIVRMAWEDRTSFECIRDQFQIGPNEVVKFMRSKLKRSAFELWRKRATSQGHLKQGLKRGIVEVRFKSQNQRTDGSIKQR